MASLTRITTFAPDTVIKSQEMNDELDQLISGHNDHDTNKLNKAGDTMTGLLILSGDPAAALGAVTKQYADALLDTATFTGLLTASGGLSVSGGDLTVTAGNDLLTNSIKPATDSDITIDLTGATTKNLIIDHDVGAMVRIDEAGVSGTGAIALETILDSGATNNIIKQTGASEYTFGNNTAGRKLIFLANVGGMDFTTVGGSSPNGRVEFSGTSSNYHVLIKRSDLANAGTLRVTNIDDEGGTELFARDGTVLRIDGGDNFTTRMASTVIEMTNLPTSDPLSSGQLWIDSGTLKVSA
jgi:hypothetical protein